MKPILAFVLLAAFALSALAGAPVIKPMHTHPVPPVIKPMTGK